MELVLKRSVLAVWLLTLFAHGGLSCAPRVNDFKKAENIDRFMDSWVGRYQSELIASWGPPSRVAPDGKGGAIITYESVKGTWGSKKDQPFTGGTQYRTPPRQPGYVAIRTFYVNDGGIVYSWKWSGL